MVAKQANIQPPLGPVKSENSSRRLQRRGVLSRTRRRGAAVTEFAIVAPLFLLMVMGIIELGRALMVQQVLINASRVGARAAITLGATTSDVQTAVQDYAQSVAVPGVTVTVTPNPASATAGTMMSVATSVNFNQVSWLASPWFLNGKSLTADSHMRKEGF